MESLLLLKYGEIALKGLNRNIFEKKLLDNIKASLWGLTGYKVSKENGRMYVSYDKNDEDEVIRRVSRVFGLVSVCPVRVVENNIDAIRETALEMVRELLDEKPFKTFKVESRRTDKKFPLTSPEISIEVGGYINVNVDEISVDVKKPEVMVCVEVRERGYVYCKEIPCYGGMPYGTSGKAALLLSGGIDSPVAGWMMAKRGVELIAVHFHSFPFTSERAKEKVMDLAKIMATFTGRMKVFNVNLLEIQQEIGAKCPESEMTILSRRFMMMIAERVALQEKCQALITGENIAQVASQTMEGLTVTNASVSMPVFRPLIAYDKNDIINIAKNIGTFETSILPFEDCCTVFLPKKVATKPRLKEILESEALLDAEGLIEKALASMEVIEIIREK